jgi:NAD(P)H-hydrate epimerase
VIADPDGQTYLNPTGNMGMATGGSGDVLSGVIGAFLSFGMPPTDAAASGAFVHGLAGDLALHELGTYGMAASDIIRMLPHALRSIKGY